MLPIPLWPSIPLSQRSRLPDKPGLYAVRFLGLTWYVGKAREQSIRDRWQGHHRYPQAKRLPWCRIAYCVMHKREIDAAEKRLIGITKRPWTWNNTRVPSQLELWCWDLLGVLVVWGGLVGVGVLVVSLIRG